MNNLTVFECPSVISEMSLAIINNVIAASCPYGSSARASSAALRHLPHLGKLDGICSLEMKTKRWVTFGMGGIACLERDGSVAEYSIDDYPGNNILDP